MFFKSSRKNKNLIKVDDNFATLVEVTGASSSTGSDFKSQNVNSSLRFEFRYKISQIEALKENALSVLITIRKNNKSRSIITRSNKAGTINTDELLENILFHKIRIIDNNAKDSDAILANKTSDITAKINNHILEAIRSGGATTAEEIGLKKTKIVVTKKDSYKAEKIDTQKKYTDSSGNEIANNTILNSTVDRIKCLKINGISPSEVTSMRERVFSIFTLKNGNVTKSKRNEFSNDPLVNVLNSYLSQEQNRKFESEYITTVDQVFEDIITAKSDFWLPQRIAQESTSLLVRFELIKTIIDKTGSKKNLTIDRVEKDLNVQEQIEQFFKPVTPPSIGVSKTSQNIHLNINEKDSKASSIALYKRSFKNGDMNQPYVEIGTINVSKNGTSKYSIPNFNEDCVIFRAVPYNKISNSYSNEFTDVVLKNPRFTDKKLVIIARQQKNGKEGIKVTAYNSSPNIVAARLLIKDVTSGNQNKQFESAKGLFNFSSKTKSSSLEIVSGLVDGHVYEFSTKIITDHGEEYQSNCGCVLEYVKPESNPFNISFGPPKLSFDDRNANAQFSITASLIEDQVSALRRIMTNLSINYNLDSLNERNAFFDKCVAFGIRRHNITTGEIDDMGIVNNSEIFDDFSASSARNIRLLNSQNLYKYVATLYVRDPKTILTEQNTVRDQETKKDYKEIPAKHKNPVALKKGNIMSLSSILNSTRQEMTYGNIGISHDIDVNFNVGITTISDLRARKVGKSSVYLSWKIIGDSSKIDHIIIMKSSDGAKTIIGKTHPNLTQYVHMLSENDLGINQYMTVPIYLDYSSGGSNYSNSVVIDSID